MDFWTFIFTAIFWGALGIFVVGLVMAIFTGALFDPAPWVQYPSRASGRIGPRKPWYLEDGMPDPTETWTDED